MRRLILLLILAAALTIAALSRLRGGPGISVNEWRNSPAGGGLNAVFDEPAHPPWNW